MNYAPIILFVYNRPKYLKKTVESLLQSSLAEKSDLYIFSDGAKNEKQIENVNEVRAYIRSICGFKSITIEESTINKGLANSIIYGVTKILKSFECAIVVEDDLIFDQRFLDYMNEGLNRYKNAPKIWSITGYTIPIVIPKYYKYDIFLSYCSSSLGWATWSDRWELVDWTVADYNEFINDKKAIALFNRAGYCMTDMLIGQMIGDIDSWFVRWCYSQYKNNRYSVFPTVQLVLHIGFDGTGTHSYARSVYRANKKLPEPSTKVIKFTNDLTLNDEITKRFQRYSGSKLRFSFIAIVRKLKMYYMIRILYRFFRNPLRVFRK